MTRLLTGCVRRSSLALGALLSIAVTTCTPPLAAPTAAGASPLASLALAPLAAGTATAAPPESADADAASSAAPDLELVALQTAGPGRIGSCNSVVARLHNAGTAPSPEAPEVRLDVHGEEIWSRTERAPRPVGPGETIEVWFHDVPLQGGRLTLLEAISDPADRVRESNETNNARRVHRDPQLLCGAPDGEVPPGHELRVHVRRLESAAGPGAAVEEAEVEVSSPLGAGAVIARGRTGPDGTAVLELPANERSPVLRVTVGAPGCAPEMRLAPLAVSPARATDLDLEVSCAVIAEPAREVEPGILEIETALPGLLRIDEREAVPVGPGSRIEEHRPGARVRVRASSAHGLVFHDEIVAVPRDRGVALVVDAPPLFALPGGDALEDLRSGLLWTVGATTTASHEEAATVCAGVERAGAIDWRLPSIDELVFVLGVADGGTAARQGLGGLSPCCLWSATEHSVGGALTYYLDGGHIYGRRPEESGIGALCVRGTPYDLDPLLVPQRYRDRLPARRSFTPPP
ncbi:MAG TPA: CARDB domain-containing protein [Thermoanaerobaculia bacterium]|nr:CARDB domain-containing protein [Thermoanaerobaculia bacterium]